MYIFDNDHQDFYMFIPKFHNMKVLHLQSSSTTLTKRNNIDCFDYKIDLKKGIIALYTDLMMSSIYTLPFDIQIFYQETPNGAIMDLYNTMQIQLFPLSNNLNVKTFYIKNINNIKATNDVYVQTKSERTMTKIFEYTADNITDIYDL